MLHPNTSIKEVWGLSAAALEAITAHVRPTNQPDLPDQTPRNFPKEEREESPDGS